MPHERLNELIFIGALTSPTISSRLGKGSKLGLEAKVRELGDEPFGLQIVGATIEMGGTEILELCAVLEHVIDRREATAFTDLIR